MTDETRLMTYDEIAEAFGISRESARRLTIRKRWSRRNGNDGKARIAVPAEEFETRADTPVSTPHDTVVVTIPDTAEDRDEERDMSRVIEALDGHIETLKAIAERERERAEAERTRADVERARADGLTAELMQTRANGIERVAEIEKRLVELRELIDRSREPRSWWRRLMA